MEQLEDTLAASEVAIIDEDRASLDEASPPGRVIALYYEADFGPHQFKW